jgi:uncharacterized protein GlcG (DUF336 family)
MKPIRPSAAALSLAALFAGLGTAAAQPAPAPAPAPPYGAPITLEQARVVAAAAEAEARRRGIAIAVAVVDSGGFLVLEERMTGASLASSETVFLKARSAVLWQRPTSSWLPAIEASHGSQATFPDVYAGNGGEMIVAGGRIVGGVGIGGSGPNEAEISKLAANALH